ncbi:MAG: hypothetical protein QTN59_10590 [Candidatus Electrothrix communis]|nr:MAG: hypothetical protein QTN59_10590 [Candidatus Electrothrix communis]
MNPDIHHRRSIRLRNYDYSRAGAYWNRGQTTFSEYSTTPVNPTRADT